MRGGCQDGDGGDDREGGEGDEAEPVQHLHDCSHDQLHLDCELISHHSRKLPVILNRGSVFVLPQLVRDHLCDS